MINFFTPSANDASLEYMSKIFGNVNGIIPGTGGTITLLGTMFRTFNAALLVVATLIVVYITVIGIMMTAHEGEFMKKWNSLWTPIKVVIGIAALVPTASGFCGLQIIMMWVIVQGVGAADTLWNTVLSFINTTGSPFAQINIASTGVASSVADIYKGLLCDESARATYPPPYVTSPQTGQYYCSTNNSWCGSPTNLDPGLTNVNNFNMGPNGSCGTLTYCNQETACNGPAPNNDSASLGCQTCKAQVTALANVITTLRDTANIYVKADYEYQNFYTNGYLANGKPNPAAKAPDWVNTYCTAQGISPALCRGPIHVSNTEVMPGSLPDPLAGAAVASKEVVTNVYWPYAVKPVVGNDNFITTGVNYYMNAIGTALSSYLASQAQNASALSGQFANAQLTGWLYAGAYYYTIAQVNKSNIQNTLPTLTVNVTDPQTGTPENPNSLMGYRNNFTAAGELIRAMQGTGEGPGGEATAILADGSSAIGTMMLSATNNSGANPLVQLAAAGYGLLFAAQILFFVFLYFSFGLGVISGINTFILGTGGFNPLAVATPVLMMILVPMLGGLLGVMVSMGATLGVYVPLIPYTIFTFGAIGWLMATIETMVAGPLVAIGILAPGGHHEILGKADHALMLMFNVFLRPSLMIFGLIAALLLASVVVTMINTMFFTVMFQIIGAGTGSLDTGSSNPSAGTAIAAAANPLELIIFLIAYVSLIISALNKCFAAIHIIPERVMTWIGGQAVSYGEAEGLGEVKRGVEAGAGAVGGGLKQGGQVAQSLGESKGKKKAYDAGKKAAQLTKDEEGGAGGTPPAGPTAT